MASSLSTLSSFLFALLLSVSLVSGDAHNDKLTHIRLYIHEVFTGPNATAVTVVASPVNNSSSGFGSMGVLDDVLRVGPEPTSKPLGRFQGLLVHAGMESAGFTTMFSFVFTAGNYSGSTLTIIGRVAAFRGIERSIVGGTGKFRMARGYSLMKLVNDPTPTSVVFEVDLYVLMYNY